MFDENYMNHKLIYNIKLNHLVCLKCNVDIFHWIDSYNNYIYYLWDYIKKESRPVISCDEQIIKNIIE